MWRNIVQIKRALIMINKIRSIKLDYILIKQHCEIP